MDKSAVRQVYYEYPFNERIRTLLRLEDLFDKLAFFRAQSHSYCHHSALLTLFEILEVTSRADLRSDLLQEMERHKQVLGTLRDNPHVSETALLDVLREVEAAQQSLNASTGKAGQNLRENEWLTSIRSRASIPGGTCEFDLPAYHAWLMQDAATRTEDIDRWIQPLGQFRAALSIVLRLLRESAQQSAQVAAAGAFQQMLQGKSYTLLQVRVDATLEAVPEISANKYMLWIRFTSADRDVKPRPVERDIPFHLALCAF